MLSCELNDVFISDPRRTAGTQATKVPTNTNTLLVRNIPDNADEELLEMFFESTKKQGGGPVKSVKILSDKNSAFIEFCDRKSVETVMKKRPIKLGKTELDVQPYSPLIKGSRKINRVDLIGFSGEFTDDLVKKHLEYLSRSASPDYEPELIALIKIGSRVVRGKDWMGQYGNEDGGGEGTVTGFYYGYGVGVRWDNGNKNIYRLGEGRCYDIQLAP